MADKHVGFWVRSCFLALQLMHTKQIYHACSWSSYCTGPLWFSIILWEKGGRENSVSIKLLGIKNYRWETEKECISRFNLTSVNGGSWEPQKLLAIREAVVAERQGVLFQQIHRHKENTLDLSLSPEIQGQRTCGRKEAGCSSSSMLKYHRRPGVYIQMVSIFFLLEVILIY